MKKKVLYVDDEEANLRTFHSVFRRDYDVVTASSGRKGLQLLEEEDPDVLITDQCMPEMNGVELLRLLFERTSRTRPARIMLSGFEISEEVQEAKRKYMLQKFISKPWKREEMKKIIEELM